MSGTLLPRRRHVLSLKIQADTTGDLIYALEDFARKVCDEGLGLNGACGGVSTGWSYEYSEDPSVTPEVYQARLMHYVELFRAERAAGSVVEVRP